LQYLGDLGLFPQVEVQVETVAPFEGPLTVWVKDTQHVLGRKVASQVRVRILQSTEIHPLASREKSNE
jgi:Fe2+ transport system protein FeoA